MKVICIMVVVMILAVPMCDAALTSHAQYPPLQSIAAGMIDEALIHLEAAPDTQVTRLLRFRTLSGEAEVRIRISVEKGHGSRTGAEFGHQQPATWTKEGKTENLIR